MTDIDPLAFLLDLDAHSDGRDLLAFADGMRHLVSSADPSIVFASLARVSVPDFSDRCVITVREYGGRRTCVAVPHGGWGTDRSGATVAPRWSGDRVLRLGAQSAPADGSSYDVLIVHLWREHVPSRLDQALARLSADRAVAAVREERLAGRLR